MRAAARLLHLVLVCALALGAVVLPSLSRCVDAAGHDEIELSNSDCCVGTSAAAGVESAGSCIGGCVDGRLIVPSLSRTSDGKHAVKSPLLVAVPWFATPFDTGVRASRVPACAFREATDARSLLSGSSSVLLC